MADSAPGERLGDPVALRSGYERLREAVLSGRPEGWRLEHGVLATRGTVAWIAAVTEAGARPEAGAGEGEARPVASAASSLPGVAQIVGVLAQMALAHAA
ncbi:MAG: hypothetical protein ACRDL4_05520 [Thermoleophilaceae bacterium]